MAEEYSNSSPFKLNEIIEEINLSSKNNAFISLLWHF